MSRRAEYSVIACGWRDRKGWNLAASQKRSRMTSCSRSRAEKPVGTLVTDNERDFQRIRRFVPFDFTKPWPGAQALSVVSD